VYAIVTVGGIKGVGEPIIWCVGVFANQGISKLASASKATSDYYLITYTFFFPIRGILRYSYPNKGDRDRIFTTIFYNGIEGE